MLGTNFSNFDLIKIKLFKLSYNNYRFIPNIFNIFQFFSSNNFNSFKNLSVDNFNVLFISEYYDCFFSYNYIKIFHSSKANHNFFYFFFKFDYIVLDQDLDQSIDLTNNLFFNYYNNNSSLDDNFLLLNDFNVNYSYDDIDSNYNQEDFEESEISIFDKIMDFEKDDILNSNFDLYKYILRDLVNFNESDVFYKILPSIINYNGFISFSYYNFYLNSNFFDEKVFESLFSSENYKDYIFNNFELLNINFDTPVTYIYNNHYPLLLNNNLINILFFSKKNKLDYINFSKFYKFYVSNIFEIILKKPIFFKLDTNFFKKYSFFFQVDKIVSNIKNTSNTNFSKLFYVSEMVEIIWYSFEFKDLNILSNWLTKTLAQINIKNHKKFLNLFMSVIKNNADDYQNLLRIEGFFFKIKGKIALTGNAKKKQMKFRFGRLLTSNKKNKIISEKNISKTDYGVLGFTMILTY